MSYLYLAIAFSLNAGANILLKLAATSGFSFGSLLAGQWNKGHLLALIAAILFAGNLGAYLIALENVPLSVGYPIMIGMTFVITTAAAIYLGESITPIRALGLALVMLGIVVVVRTNA